MISLDEQVFEQTKKPLKKVVFFFLGGLFRLLIGVLVFLVLYFSHKSSMNNEIYVTFTKKILVEMNKHELLKHQISQGTIEFDKKSKNTEKNIIKEIQKEPTISTDVFKNSDSIRLNNATIKNNSYTILTTIDFRNTSHKFANKQAFCTLAKHLAPELKDNIFMNVKFGEYLIHKNSKSNNKDEKELVDANCKTQDTIITIESKFYPKDLQTSPYQIQNAL